MVSARPSKPGPSSRAGQGTFHRDWLVGGGEMGDLIRAKDWSTTPLGPREGWAPSLRTAVGIMVESPIPMAVLWGHDLLLLYNDAYRLIAADRHPRALGRPAREVWPEVWHLVELIFAAVLERGESAYSEEQLFPIDRQGQREQAYFTVGYSPVRGEEGAVMGCLVTLLEATRPVRERQALREERNQAAATAARERELLAGVMEHVPAMITIYDPSLKAFHLNAEARRILGWTDEDGRTGDLLALCYPDPHELEEVRRFMESATSGWREMVATAKDGSKIISSWANVRLSDRTQIGIGIDLRERKRAEQELRENEQQLRALFERTPAMVVLSELADGRILKANDGFAQMLGFSVEEAMGRTPVELGILPIRKDRERFIDEVRKEGFVRNREITVRTKSGALATGLLSSARIENGGKERLVTVMLDITERRRADEALRQANQRLLEADRRKDEFLAILSHELRNPLAPIRNSIYILEHAADGGEQARRARQVIDRQARHMTRLIDDLLDVTRISRGKITLQRERIDLGSLARGTAEDHREQFEREGIALDISVPMQPVLVDGDPTRLAQVVGNLLSNAAKFTPRGGRTQLSVAFGAGAEAVVSVSDTGVGMPADMLGRVFEPFVQAEQSLDRTRGGLGLGLSLVKGLVAMHGGQVSVRSEGEGKGCEFTVTLPLHPAATPQPSHGPASERHASGRRVLVVEDNVDAAESLREVLELGHHEVTVATSGPEGLAAAHAFKPDVVLCDIGLPGLDGYGVARALRSDTDAELRSVTLIALSGYALDEDVAKSRAAGFDQHMAKPPSIEALERLLADDDRGPQEGDQRSDPSA